MEKSKNLKLNIQAQDDSYSIEVFNGNFEKIDADMGNPDNLQTSAKEVVGAINEVFTLGNERKAQLVKNLIAMGINCANTDTWEALIAYVLDIFTGIDVSGDTVTAETLLQNVTAHDKNGDKITGAMQDFWGSFLTDDIWVQGEDNSLHFQVPSTGRYNASGSNVYATHEKIVNHIGLTADKLINGYPIYGVNGSIPNRSNPALGECEILHPDWTGQGANHANYIQYDLYGETWDDMHYRLELMAPWGYYNGDARVYITSQELANAIGLTADKLISGQSVLEIAGTGMPYTRTSIMSASKSNDYAHTDWETIAPYDYLQVSRYSGSSEDGTPITRIYIGVEAVNALRGTDGKIDCGGIYCQCHNDRPCFTTTLSGRYYVYGVNGIV